MLKQARRNVAPLKLEDTMAPVSASLSLSDEDDSAEREVVLNSPEKGKDFRLLSKVCCFIRLWRQAH